MLLEQSVSFRARVFLSQLLSLQTHREIEVFCFVLPKVLYKYTYLWCFLRSDLLQSLNQFTLKWKLTLCTPCYGHYNSLIWIVSSLVFSTNTLNEFGFEWICVFLSLALLCQVVFFFFFLCFLPFHLAVGMLTPSYSAHPTNPKKPLAGYKSHHPPPSPSRELREQLLEGACQ